MDSGPLDHRTLRHALEDAGLRCTPQRLAVYDILIQAAHHPTAEEVYQAVRESIPRISLATVYKSLEALVAIGVATKLTAGIGATRARYDARRDLHYHFRCLRTGTVRDLPTQFDPDLVKKLDPGLADYLNRQGLQVTGYRLELIGYQDETPAETSSADIGRHGGSPTATGRASTSDP